MVKRVSTRKSGPLGVELVERIRAREIAQPEKREVIATCKEASKLEAQAEKRGIEV